MVFGGQSWIIQTAAVSFPLSPFLSCNAFTSTHATHPVHKPNGHINNVIVYFKDRAQQAEFITADLTSLCREISSEQNVVLVVAVRCVVISKVHFGCFV
jgi:hypothetical protein